MTETMIKTEQLTRVKELYQRAVMEIEGIGMASNPYVGMKILRGIIDTEPEEGTSSDDLNLWIGAAAQKLGETYYFGIEGKLKPDPLRAHYYFIMSWANSNSDSWAYLGAMYYDLGDYYHAAMYFKAVADGHLSDEEFAREVLDRMKSQGQEINIPMDENYPEFENI